MNKRLADRGLLLRLHSLGAAPPGVPGAVDEPALPLGLRDTGTVDGEAVFFPDPSTNFLVGRQLFRVKFTLIVIDADYEGEPGSVHRQTGFGYGVRIPNVWWR